MKEQVPVNEVEGNSLVGSFDGIRYRMTPFYLPNNRELCYNVSMVYQM